MDARTQKILAAVAVAAVAAVGSWLAYREPAPAARPVRETPDAGEPPAEPPGPPPTRRYRPAGPLPAQAIPGGGLAAHEGEEAGGHTLARHVGRTAEELRERLRADPDRREVSTFTDAATAERVVARALYELRRDIQTWLDKGKEEGQMAYVHPTGEVIGQVLKAGDAEPVPGRTLFLVLQPSRRFPEGFSIRAASVRTP